MTTARSTLCLSSTGNNMEALYLCLSAAAAVLPQFMFSLVGDELLIEMKLRIVRKTLIKMPSKDRIG